MNWERAMIGTALTDPEQMVHAEEVLPSDLTGPHQILWAEMLSLHQRGTLGPRALIESLRANHVLDAIAFDGVDERGEHYIASLYQFRGEEMQEYADRVIAIATKRQLRDAAALIASEARDDRVSVEEALDNAEQRVMALRRNRKDEGSTIADLAVTLSDRMERARNGEQVAAWTPKLDPVGRVMGFAEKEDYILIAGRPGDGKSTFLRYELARMALEENKPVLLFNLENSEIEIVRNIVAMMTGIGKDKLKSARLNDDERQRVANAMRQLNSVPFHIKTIGSPSGRQITTTARYYISKYNIEMIGVDYVQLMSNGIESKVQDVTASSVALRAISLNYHVPLMAAAQLSRSIEHRGNNAEPVLSDLRESGCLTGDTLIQLSDGRNVPIRELVNHQGFGVMALDDHWKIVPTMARKAWSTGVRQVFRLTTASGREIRATANHPFRTISGWVALEDLHLGDRIATPRVLSTPETSGTRSHAELALLGHLIGDGCTLPRHAIQYTTKEMLLAEKVAEVAREVFGDTIEPRIVEERDWLQVYLSSARPLHTGVRSPIAIWLDEMGIWGLRSYEKFVPPDVFRQSNEGIAIFLRHLWLTDGTMGVIGKKKPRPIIAYSSASRRLATDVQWLLVRLGIISRLSRVRNRWMVTITGKRDLLDFISKIGAIGTKAERLEEISQFCAEHGSAPNRDVVPAAVWRSLIQSALSTKGITTREFHEMMGWAYSGTQRYGFNLGRENLGRIAVALDDNSLLDLAESDVLWDEVVSIVSDGEEEVFDIEVDEMHNFVANNIVVHNSLEQDATIVIFGRPLWAAPTEQQLAMFPENVIRDGHTQIVKSNAVPQRFIVAKNRNGPIGSTGPVLFQKHINSYRVLTESEGW